MNAVMENVKRPLKKSVSTPKAVPAAVLTAIKNAPLTDGVVPVDGFKPFEGQILKAESLIFRPGSRLLLQSNGFPWLAIVAKKIKFAAPDIVAEIGVKPSLAPPTVVHPPLGRAAKGRKGVEKEVGWSGVNGLNGADGVPVVDAPPVPVLYIVAGAVEVQAGSPVPDYITLKIWHPARPAAKGSHGQSGQSGGNGGDGANSKWNRVRHHCIRAARSGGPGGAAGGGGNGGNGGRGGDGGEVVYVGSTFAQDLLEYSEVINAGASGGKAGRAGANGEPGAGGERGSHDGDCRGGSTGPTGSRSSAKPVDGVDGANGKAGPIHSETVDVATLF